MEGSAKLHLFQRLKPQGAEDIGTWQSVFTLIAGCAVVTNAGLAFFTMGVFEARRRRCASAYVVM